MVVVDMCHAEQSCHLSSDLRERDTRQWWASEL